MGSGTYAPCRLLQPRFLSLLHPPSLLHARSLVFDWQFSGVSCGIGLLILKAARFFECEFRPHEQASTGCHLSPIVIAEAAHPSSPGNFFGS